ncbi:MAG: outer membrane lipoprotein carrier protein LolA [Chitinivibrionales bacterium]|nr:outer membrane lipoprotein carrier protein LolA [Chitinivibrionales bacterium]
MKNILRQTPFHLFQTLFVHGLLYLCVILNLPVFGQDDTLLKNLKQRYASSAAMEIQFTVDIYWAIRQKHDTMKGEAVFSSGNTFNVTIGSSQWVSDGATVWQYNDKTNQVIIHDIRQIDANTLPVDILRRFLRYPFVRQDSSTSKTNKVVYRWDVPVQDSVKSQFRSIVIWVDGQNATITKLLSVDRSGNENTYTILKMKSPIKPAAHTFQFTIPKGAEVVDQRNP